MKPDQMLHQIAPGIYHDDDGGKFFYLTAMSAWMTKHVIECPRLNAPLFFTEVFAEIRSDMEKICFVELMD